jgi:hypothetical protein
MSDDYLTDEERRITKEKDEKWDEYMACGNNPASALVAAFTGKRNRLYAEYEALVAKLDALRAIRWGRNSSSES